MTPFSICLIVKNEEKNIDKCLQKLTFLQNKGVEIIVCDTGSTDDTVNIVKKASVTLHSFSWCDDFSAARNFCADKASTDWILAVDSDEFLLSDPTKVLAFFEATNFNPENVYMFTRINHTETGTTKDQTARFYHKDFYHFHGIIHEQLFRNDGSTPVYKQLPLIFDHTGYANPTISNQKANRNLTLLKKAYEKDSEDPYTLFQIGQTLRILGNFEEALFYFEKALTFDVNPKLDYIKTLIESYGYTLLDLKRPKDALTLTGIYDTFCDRADFVFLMGTIYMQNGMFEKAISEYKKAVTIPSYCVEGVNSYSAYYNIGVIYECLGDTNNAHDFYKLCGDFAPAINRLKVI